MKKDKGSALVDYVLPTAIVGLVFGLGIYSFAEGGNLFKFLSASANMSKTSQIGEAKIGGGSNKFKGGYLGGTPTSPKTQCDFGGTCNVDYGPFVLTGIPQNFNGFVESSGTSGGSEKIADIFEQIAQSYNESGDQQGYEDFKKLANLVHMNADFIRQAEDKVKSGADQAALQSYSNQSLASIGYTVPSDLQSTLPNLDTTSTYSDFLKWNSNLYFARYDQLHNSTNFNNKKDKVVSYAIVDAFDKITSDARYSDSLKTLTQEMYLSLNDLTTKSSTNILAIASGGGVAIDTGDPLTATSTGIQSFPIPAINQITNPNYSLNSDLKGAIVCTAGKNLTTARSCH